MPGAQTNLKKPGCLWVFLTACLLCTPLWAQGKVALVIGNNDYGADSLKNPVNDARAISRVLEGIGFTVTTSINANKTSLDDVLYNFGEAAESADIALVYFAGHAIEVDGRNYMMPTGITLKKRRDLKKLIDMQEFVDEASLASSLGLVIIDACRDNPFANTLQATLGRSVGSRGLARVDATSGNNTLIAFATEAGQIALDGRGKNSPYAKALIRNLSRKGVDVRKVMGQVRDDVMAETGRSQRPYTYGSLGGRDLFLAEGSSDPSTGLGRLTVKVEPEDASVRIMNIGPKYHPGIELAIGERYDVYVTREGYLSHSQSVVLNKTNQVLGVVLSRPGGAVSVPDSPQWIEPEMVTIPGGRFQMGDLSGEGDDDEKPVHHVSIEGFSLGRYEVTVKEFRAFIDASGYKTDAEKNSNGKSGCYTWKDSQMDWRDGYNWRSPGIEQTQTDPVVCVSWNDAKAYIKWLNEQTKGEYRLPSESEWEYAARAGSKEKYSFGKDEEQLCRYGNVADKTLSAKGSSWTNKADCSDASHFTATVGAYKSNSFGLYDMHGNVWEWAEDRYHENYKRAPGNGEAWVSGDENRRVLRGGAWLARPAWVRSANRSWHGATIRVGDLGFRLARDQ